MTVIQKLMAPVLAICAILPATAESLRFGKGMQADPSLLKSISQPLSRRQAVKAKGSSLLWGNVAYMAEWPQNDKSQRGIYSFMASAPVGYPLVTDAEMQFCYGNAVVDGIFYGMTMDSERNAKLYSLDVDSWTVNSTRDITDLTLVALATAQDYTTDTVYGEFYNKDFNGYELGIIDYASASKTTVGPLANTYVAMGFHDGILYGIATDGYLYAINVSTGFENKRGATGLELSRPDGNYFMQGGIISPDDNVFYWASIDKDGYTGMYTVDLSTGQASLCGSYTGIIYALTAPVETRLSQNAPAAVTDLNVEMTGIHTAAVSFSLPSLSIDGASLDGPLSYAIQCNGADVLTGEATAGAEIARSLEILSDGTTVITVYARNAAGKGESESATVWSGYDYPLGSRSVMVTKTSDTTFEISWEAPLAGANDGYIGTLKYDVYRYLNGEKQLISSNISDTRLTDTLPSESLAVVSYGIVADNNGKKGTEVSSNVLNSGTVLIPDFLEDFRTAENFRLWTIYDSNGDDRSWQYDSEHHYAYYQSAATDADDWLISPPIQMDSRRTYKISVGANNTSNMPELIEVKMGKSPAPKGMTTTVLDQFKLMQLNQAENKFETHTNADFNVGESGEYYLGLHAMSDAYMNKLRVDSIYVEAGPLATAPAAVKDLSILADKTGKASVTLKFTAPDKNIDGTSITGPLQRIDIKRGNLVIKTFTGVNPGQTLEYLDTEAAEGYNDYRVIPWAADEYGQYTNAKVWVGYDVPSPLAEVTAEPIGDKVRLAWDKSGIIGVHGGVVDPASVTYTIYDASLAYGFAVPGDKIATTADNEFIVDHDALNGEQSLKYWMVAPANDKGEAEKTLATLLSGAIYQLPFDEHFTNGAYDKFWHLGNKKNVNVAVYPALDSSDGDGFCLQMDNYSTADDSQDVISGKINISAASNPTLLFDFKGNDKINAVSVYAITSNGDKVDLGNINSSADWGNHQISLANVGKGEFINIAFHVEFAPMDDTTWEYGTAWIDNIKVVDLLKHNLFVEIAAPAKVFAGLADEPANVLVTVKNTGEESAEKFTVTLLADDNTLWSEDIEALAPLTNASYNVSFAPGSEYDTTEVILKATVDYAPDEFSGDNEAEQSILVIASEAKAPENLNVDPSTGLMTWNAADTTPETIVEDFEAYTPWITDNIGDWNVYDGDHGTVQGLFSGIANPVENTEYAFAVFAPGDYTGDGSGIDMTATYPNLAPHSGRQYLTATRAVAGWNAVQQDNWFISPLLPCVEQQLSFWVNNNSVDGYPYVETFSVWGSSQSRAIADFEPVSGDLQASSGEWTEIKVDLPAKYKYFAIRQTSGAWDSYFFMIDDISYSRGGGAIDHFNVFVDGEKVAENKVGQPEYQLTDIASDHTLAVSTVYTNGLESKRVSTSFVPSGIGTVISEQNPADIYSVDGYLVRRSASSTSGLVPGIYIANGHKIVVK